MGDKQKFSVVIKQDAYKSLINSTLGNEEVARKFVAEISTVVSQNPSLSNCDAASILSAGLLAQTLELPLASSLGFAYIVPYNTKTGQKAQFQIGYKGLIQLAQRSGAFKRLGVREVHDGEYIGQDEFGEDVFKFSHDYDLKKTIGYYAYFELVNGFVKTMYWTKAQVEEHAKKYSKSFGNGSSTDLWHNNFNLMASKTVLKLLLNRYAPLSVDMKLTTAIRADQAIIGEDGKYSYVDNPNSPNSEEETPTPTTRKKVANKIVEETGEIITEHDKEEISVDNDKSDLIGEVFK